MMKRWTGLPPHTPQRSTKIPACYVIVQQQQNELHTYLFNMLYFPHEIC